MERWWNDTDREDLQHCSRQTTWPSAAVSIKNPTQTGWNRTRSSAVRS